MPRRSDGGCPRPTATVLDLVTFGGGCRDSGGDGRSRGSGCRGFRPPSRSVSVAARGLMALDQLLFIGAAPVEAGSYTCRLLVAITGDSAATADRLLDRWRDPWGGLLTSAGDPANPVYLAPEELTRALYSALTDGLQADIDLRLGRPMGTFHKPQPGRAEVGDRGGRCRASSLRWRAAPVFSRAWWRRRSDPTRRRRSIAAFEAAPALGGRVAAPIDHEVATPQGRFRVEALQTRAAAGCRPRSRATSGRRSGWRAGSTRWTGD